MAADRSLLVPVRRLDVVAGPGESLVLQLLLHDVRSAKLSVCHDAAIIIYTTVVFPHRSRYKAILYVAKDSYHEFYETYLVEFYGHI